MIRKLSSLLGRLARRGAEGTDTGPFDTAAGRTTLTPHLVAVVRAFPDPCLVLDAGGNIRGYNEEAREVLKLDRVNQPVSFALRAPEVVEAVGEVASLGRPLTVRYYERVPTDRWFEAHVAPVSVKPGEAHVPPDAILVVLHDMTQARRLERMRADFVANASHELRTPLAALTGFIETLQGPARNDVAARERFLAIMHSQAARMSRLIDDLLSLSRFELSAHVRPNTVADLREIAAHVVDALSPIARDRGVALTFEAPGRPIRVLGERDELIRVCENLIENAIKYGATGKRVMVTAGTAKGDGGAEEAFFSVEDFGPGIAPEHLPRLTERFYRVDVAESREKGGTGLGLAIVKHILNRHRGRLIIRSEFGEGATFTARLGLVEGEATERPKAGTGGAARLHESVTRPS